MTIEKDVQTLASLQDQRDTLLGRIKILGTQNEQLRRSANAGEKTAKAKIDKINIEASTIGHEIVALEAQIAEVELRLFDARLVLADAATIENANQLAALKKDFIENGINAGDALDDFIGSIKDMIRQRDDMEALGLKAPSARQFHVSLMIAIKTIIQKLPQPMVNELQEWRLLGYPARRTFQSITADWDATITRQFANRLPKKQEAA